MTGKVAQHLECLRRRSEEVQEFAGAAIAGTYEAVTEQSLLEIESQIDEVRAIAYSMKRELEEVRSYLGYAEA